VSTYFKHVFSMTCMTVDISSLIWLPSTFLPFQLLCILGLDFSRSQEKCILYFELSKEDFTVSMVLIVDWYQFILWVCDSWICDRFWWNLLYNISLVLWSSDNHGLLYRTYSSVLFTFCLHLFAFSICKSFSLPSSHFHLGFSIFFNLLVYFQKFS
jgi:hypothetical protein